MTNPDVTQGTIGRTICVSGWTKTVRPPVSYTDALKRKLMADLHLPGSLSDFELDHFLSIEDGGSPTDPKNLWMEHYSEPWGARTKDQVETKLKRLVCSHKITLADAQAALREDWTAAYKKYVAPAAH